MNQQVKQQKALLEHICEGMNFKTRVLTEEVYNEFYHVGRMIAEAQLTQDQIQQLFKSVADGADKGFNVDAPGGDPNVGSAGANDNKTLLGKMSGAWQNLKSKIAQSGPVSGFDVAVDKIQQQVAAKSGPDGALTKIVDGYRKFGDKHPIMQGIIIAGLTAAIATGGGLGAAGVAGVAGGLRTLDRLLMGDRASSALWKGFKAGALGYGIASLLQGGDTFTQTTQSSYGGSGGAETVGSGGDVSSGLGGTDGGAGAGAGNGAGAGTTITAPPGSDLSTIAQQYGVSVDQMLQANPQVTHADQILSGETLNIPASTGQSVYQGGVGTAADTAQKVATGAYQNRPGFNESKKSAPSVVDWNKIRSTFIIQESLKLPLRSAVYLTPYGVQKVFETVDKYQTEIDEGIFDAIKTGWNNAKNKITYDKLDMWWRRNRGENPTEGPVDSQVVVDFLTKMGVKKGLVDKAFNEIGIPNSVSPNSVPPSSTPPGSTPGSTPPGSTPGSTPPGGGRVSAADARKQVDQTVQTISRVRKRDKGRVVTYAQNKFGSLGSSQPASAPQPAPAKPKPAPAKPKPAPAKPRKAASR